MNQCRKLHTKGQIRTYHDPKDEENGKVINFNSFMGIDYKGKNS